MSPIAAPPTTSPAQTCIPGGVPDSVLGRALCGQYFADAPTEVWHWASSHWRHLATLAVVLLTARAAVWMIRRHIWRRNAGRAHWLEIVPPVTATPAATVALWRLLSTLLPAPRPGTLYPLRLVWEVVATPEEMRCGLWVPAGVNPTAVIRVVQRAWPGARLTDQPPPSIPASRPVAGRRLVAARPEWLPLVEEDPARASWRAGTPIAEEEDRMRAVYDGLAAAGRTGGGLLQVVVGRAPRHRVAALRRATTDPTRAHHASGTAHVAALLADALRAAVQAALNLATPGPSTRATGPHTRDPYTAELARQARTKHAVAPHLLAHVRAFAAGPTTAAARAAVADITSGYGLLSGHLTTRRLGRPRAAARWRWASGHRMVLATAGRSRRPRRPARRTRRLRPARRGLPPPPVWTGCLPRRTGASHTSTPARQALAATRRGPGRHRRRHALVEPDMTHRPSRPHQPPRRHGRSPRRLVLVSPERRHGLGGKVIGVANAGTRVRVGIALPDCRQHIHILGPTGTGKSSLVLRMILDDADNGRGVAVFDPKGDLIRDVLDRLPADCGDRLVIIDPDETAAPPALNLLDPSLGGSPHDVAAHITSVMARVWSRWWGHRTADIAHHGLLTLAHTPGSTLAHLPRLLSDPSWRTARVATATDRLGAWQAGTLAEFWEGFDAASAGQRAALVAPLLAKLRLVLAHPLAAGLFGVPATTFTLADILDGGILLVRLPKGIVGEDGCRLVGSLLLAGLWQATTARARLPENQRRDCAVYVDECHNFLHLPIGLDDALAEARGLHTSFVLAHQYLGQLSDEMAEAIDANARNKVYFALAPKDAADQARHIRPYLDEGDLIRLGGFEVVLRPVAGGRIVPPVTADTLPPPPPHHPRAQALRADARSRSGLTQRARRTLLGEAATTEPSPTPVPGTPRALVGRNTFAAAASTRPASSNKTSNESSNERSNGDDNAGQPTAVTTPDLHVDRPGEDQWTGTD